MLQDIDAAEYHEHHYGLTPERWDWVGRRSYWVTGAGTGYGRCIACGLAATGAQVFLTGRRVKKLQESIDTIASLDIPTENCRIVEADLTDYNEIVKACDRVRDSCRSLSGLVNNAAIFLIKDILDTTTSDWDHVINTNPKGTFLCTRAVSRYMMEQRNGTIFNITLINKIICH